MWTSCSIPCHLEPIGPYRQVARWCALSTNLGREKQCYYETLRQSTLTWSTLVKHLDDLGDDVHKHSLLVHELHVCGQQKHCLQHINKSYRLWSTYRFDFGLYLYHRFIGMYFQPLMFKCCVASGKRGLAFSGCMRFICLLEQTITSQTLKHLKPAGCY